MKQVLLNKTNWRQSLIAAIFSIMMLIPPGAKAQDTGWTLEDNTLTILTNAGMTHWETNFSGDKSAITNLVINAGVTDIYIADMPNLAKIETTGSGFVFEDNVLFADGKTTLYACLPSKELGYFIPDGVEKIKSGAFANCHKLTQIIFPATVKTIESGALSCNELTNILFIGITPPEINELWISSSPKLTTIWVPRGAADAYKAKMLDAHKGMVSDADINLYLSKAHEGKKLFLKHTKAEGWSYKVEDTGTYYPFYGSIIGTPSSLNTSLTIESAGEGATLTLEDVKLSTAGSPLTINQDVTLTIKSKYLNQLVSKSESTSAIHNNGTLTIEPRSNIFFAAKTEPIGGTGTLTAGSTPLLKLKFAEAPDYDLGLGYYYPYYWEVKLSHDNTGYTHVVYTAANADQTYNAWHYDSKIYLRLKGKLEGSADHTLELKPGAGYYTLSDKDKLVGEGADATITDDSLTVTTNNSTANNITVNTATVTFSDVNTEALTAVSGKVTTITLTGANTLGDITVPTGGDLTLTEDDGPFSYYNSIKSVTCDGNFTDKTGTVTDVKDGTGATLLSITRPDEEQKIPAGSDNLTLAIQATEGATYTVYYKDDKGEWQVQTPLQPSGRSLRAGGSISATLAHGEGTYRIAIIRTITYGQKTVTLFTKPFKVKKETPTPPPTPPTPPYVPTYYNVTIHPAEGAVTSPRANTYVIEEGYNFTFTLTLQEGYSSSQAVVKANGTVITPRISDGKYILRNVMEDTDVVIEGIVKDQPTGNATLEAGTLIRAQGSSILIRTDRTQEMQLFSFTGQLLHNATLPAGETQVGPLTAGIYLVRLADGTSRKVIIK